MDNMYQAIKGRRSGLMNGQGAEAAMPDQEGGSDSVDMQSLIGALSKEQKAELLAMLVGGQNKSEGTADPMNIAKGGVGPGEMAELEEETLGEGHETEDDIAEGMISSSDKMRSAQGDKPRNLGERMKFNLAMKQKNKGK